MSKVKLFSYSLYVNNNLFADNHLKLYVTNLFSGNSCLIHCAQGKSRSVAIAITFIALAESISIDVALENVQKCRKMADPNPGFMDQLHTFERNDVLKELKKENDLVVKNNT